MPESIANNLSLPDLPGEVWKDIAGYEGKYQVSNLGRIKSVKRKVYNPKLLGNGCYRTVPERIRKHNILKGYHCVSLSIDHHAKGFKIHRLVAEAFIGPAPGPEYQINHKDGNKANNKASNLEWVTPAENTSHAYRTGLVPPQSEVRKKASSRYFKERWKDPEYRAMQENNMQKVWNDPNSRKIRTKQITEGIHSSQAKRYLRNRTGAEGR